MGMRRNADNDNGMNHIENCHDVEGLAEEAVGLLEEVDIVGMDMQEEQKRLLEAGDSLTALNGRWQVVEAGGNPEGLNRRLQVVEAGGNLEGLSGRLQVVLLLVVGMHMGKNKKDYRDMDMEQVGMDLNVEVGIEDEG